MHLEPQSITALILCGGQSSRMGGQDKGLIELRGQTLVKIALDRCQPHVGGIMINANRHLTSYQAYGWPTFADELEGYLGPLAGFQVGLMHAQTPYLLVLPCDTPLFPDDLINQLAQTMAQHDVDCTYATTIENGIEQPHPVFCLLKKSTLNSLNTFLQTGQRKIDRWFETLSHRKVLFSEPSAFLNVNTPQELAQVERLMP